MSEWGRTLLSFVRACLPQAGTLGGVEGVWFIERFYLPLPLLTKEGELAGEWVNRAAYPPP